METARACSTCGAPSPTPAAEINEVAATRQARHHHTNTHMLRTVGSAHADAASAPSRLSPWELSGHSVLLMDPALEDRAYPSTYDAHANPLGRVLSKCTYEEEEDTLVYVAVFPSSPTYEELMYTVPRPPRSSDLQAGFHWGLHNLPTVSVTSSGCVVTVRYTRVTAAGPMRASSNIGSAAGRWDMHLPSRQEHRALDSYTDKQLSAEAKKLRRDARALISAAREEPSLAAATVYGQCAVVTANRMVSVEEHLERRGSDAAVRAQTETNGAGVIQDMASSRPQVAVGMSIMKAAVQHMKSKTISRSEKQNYATIAHAFALAVRGAVPSRDTRDSWRFADYELAVALEPEAFGERDAGGVRALFDAVHAFQFDFALDSPVWVPIWEEGRIPANMLARAESWFRRRSKKLS